MKWMLLLTALVSLNASADSFKEISHLLNFVKSTDCTYERNGKRHTGAEALGHIKKKYDYFSDDIETAEDFIQYAATKSKMSGKFYLVHCPSQPTIKSQDWLLAELKRYRSSAK